MVESAPNRHLCRLRPVHRSDLETSLPWRNDPHIRDMVMGYRFPVTEVMEQGWYERLAADQGERRATFGVEDGADGKLVGFVHISDIDWQCRTAEFGVVIGETARHRSGLGRQASSLAISYAFETLNLARLTVRYLAANAGAERMFAALGFVVEGRLRSAGYSRGHAVDVIIAGLLRAEFRPAASRSSP